MYPSILELLILPTMLLINDKSNFLSVKITGTTEPMGQSPPKNLALHPNLKSCADQLFLKRFIDLKLFILR